jgi:2-methylcitrate dehydratase PrpD
MMKTVVHADQTLTEGLWALCLRPASEADRQRAVLHLVDWLGCAIAGAATPTGRAMAGDSHIFAGSGVAGATAIGGLGSLLEMDDVHRTALLHPGPVVMASVMALADQAPHADLLGAILAGYEAMVRLGAAVGPGHYAFFHNTGTCGGIGSAAAAAHILGLTEVQAVWAMGHAVSTAGGLWQCRNEPCATKHLHVAEAARRGVQAALWAQAGLVGPRHILEGPQGFFAAVARDGDPDAVLASPDDWRIHQVSFKPWPACRHAHPTIDAALKLRSDLRGRTIAKVRVKTFADAIMFCDRPNPQTEAQAKFSLQHSVAVTFLSGPPVLADFSFDRIADPALARLRALTEVIADPDLTAHYPAHFGAVVEVETTDGARLAAEVTDALGDSENPLDQSAILAKFYALTAYAGVQRREAETLAVAALALGNGASSAPLRAAMATLTFPSG